MMIACEENERMMTIGTMSDAIDKPYNGRTHYQDDMLRMVHESQLPTISVDLVRKAERSEDTPSEYNRAALVTAERRYRQFLYLCKTFPDQPLSPCHDIDLIWHLHMLSPRAYFEDCQKIFGDMLDHDGGFGAIEEERPELERVFGNTAKLFEQVFGEVYLDTNGGSSRKCVKACRVKECRRACKKG